MAVNKPNLYTVARDPEDTYDLNLGRAYCVDCKITTWPYANRVDSDQYLGCDGVWSDPSGYFTYIVIGLVLAYYFIKLLSLRNEKGEYV